MADRWMKLIVNPAAGAGRAGRQWPQVQGLLGSIGLRYEHALTEARGHGIELAREAVRAGWEVVVSVGGDGTVHEVANGMHQAGGGNDVTLGIIGIGTGTDYLRTLGISRRFEEACRALPLAGRQQVDVGLVDYTLDGKPQQRLFVNFAGAGFDAEIVRRTTQQYKSLGSLGSYLMGLLATVATYRNPEVTLAVDGEVSTRKACTVLVSNGRYGGGGMCPAPNADLTDGVFDLLVIGDISRPDLLWSLPRIYRGTHLTHPKVSLVNAREVSLTSARPLSLQADGELLGGLPARFSILPGALTIAV
ncbi:diacylglycerol/lipid kinase family protein [Chloroflexota bacterium]